MKLDLLALAKRVEETYYKDIECSFGTVRVYHTPEPMIWTYKPARPAPIEPVVKMKTATGSQNRAIKASDEGYEDWIKDSEAYKEEKDDIQLAARHVLALRDLDTYPDDLSEPPPLVQKNNIAYPEHEMLRKKTWLDHTVLALVSDLIIIQEAMMVLSRSTSADSVEEIKKNSGLNSKGDSSGKENSTVTEA